MENTENRKKFIKYIAALIAAIGLTGGCTTVYVLQKGDGYIQIEQSSKNEMENDSINNNLEL